MPIDMCRRRTRGGGLGEWEYEESTNVTFGLLFRVGCFCRCLSDGGRIVVEPGLLFMRLQVWAVVQRQFEELFVEAVKLGSSLVESNNSRLKLGFALCFLISGIGTVEIGASEFPARARVSLWMVENLLKPALACEFPGTHFVLMIDVVLLNLDPVMTEVASQQV